MNTDPGAFMVVVCVSVGAQLTRPQTEPLRISASPRNRTIPRVSFPNRAPITVTLT